MKVLPVLVLLAAACSAPPGPVAAAPEPEDPGPDRAREWIENLRSERVEERDEAARQILALGPAAMPALRAAAGDSDPEVQARARVLLQTLEGERENALVLVVRSDGALLQAGSTVAGAEEDLALEAFFGGLREKRRREEGRAISEAVTFPVLIWAHRSTRFEFLQRVLLAAARNGAVVRVRLPGD